MLHEKEVARPGTYWYRDQETGAPRKLVVTPEMTKYWHDQGNAMLATGLTVPVPVEHDFDAHPMTPKEKALNNAGWVKNYVMGTLKEDGTRENDHRLYSLVDIQDPDIANKVPTTLRWTSPWISSFMDGNGKEWKNVIAHLALTTRPRIIEQEPFKSVAAALSLATKATINKVGNKGLCLSRAGLLKPDGMPEYPVAFSLVCAPLAQDPEEEEDDFEGDDGPDSDDADGVPDDPDSDNVDLPPFNDPAGDVSMTELLCDLLGALGVHCDHSGDDSQFKRNLYNAAMTKIHELAGKAQSPPNRTNPPGYPPNNPSKQNPLIQQEQQPMFMSLEDINKLPDPMKGVALAMHAENVKLRGEMEAAKKTTDSLRDAKLKEANEQRDARISILCRMSPKTKEDLEKMKAQPAMALSMGDGGTIIDPMGATLSILEKGLSNLPLLLQSDAASLSVQPHPSDDGLMTEERSEELAAVMARRMGVPAKAK